MPGQTRREKPGRRQETAAQLGVQLEDLFVHVLRCEHWARIDDRIDLAERLYRTRKTSA
jgi:hypothetical protein